MRLIIDIPKEEYELIVNDESCGLHPLTRAIANGITLDEVITDRVEYGADGNSYRLTISNGKELEQESKAITTSTDEPMVMYYPQVEGITPTVINNGIEPQESEDEG